MVRPALMGSVAVQRNTTAVLLLMAIWAAAGCESHPSHVVIGIALTKESRLGAVLAVREINASGGIDGVPLELEGLDWDVVDQASPEDILKWASRFADTQGLVAVIGHSDSASTLSAAAIYNRSRVPQIVTIATNPAITNIGQWTYRLCLSDAAQGPALADYAVKEWGKKRIAVFYVNDAYGRGLAQLFEKRVTELGGEIVSSVGHRNVLKADDKELIRSTLAMLKGKQTPELIALFQRVPASDWTMGAVYEAGLRVDVLGGDNLGSRSFLSSSSASKEGVRVSQFFLADPSDARTSRFLHNIQEGSNSDSDYGQAFAYDAVFLLRDAIAAKGFTRYGVKSYLDQLIRRRSEVHGIAGVYRLAEDHDARRSFYIVEVRKGGFHVLKALRVE